MCIEYYNSKFQWSHLVTRVIIFDYGSLRGPGVKMYLDKILKILWAESGSPIYENQNCRDIWHETYGVH